MSKMGLDLTVFPYHQQMIIVSLLEEIERLKERVEALEDKAEYEREEWVRGFWAGPSGEGAGIT